jgi:hypothetical protein
MAVCTCSVSVVMAFHTKSGTKFEVHNHSLNLTGAQTGVIYRQLQQIMILCFVSIPTAHLAELNYPMKEIHHLWPCGLKAINYVHTYIELFEFNSVINLNFTHHTIQVNNIISNNQDAYINMSTIIIVLARIAVQN